MVESQTTAAGTAPRLRGGPPRAAWWIVPALIAVGALLAVSAVSGASRTTGSRTFAGATSVVFDLTDAPIEVIAEGDVVLVDSDVTTGPLGGRFDLSRSGDEVRIVQRCGVVVLGWGCRGRFTVRVPASAAVSGETSNGAITLTGLAGGTDVRTSNGAVTADRLTGPATLRTSNGAVRATGIAAEVFEARTSNGRIEASFTTAPRTVRLDTSNGAVEVVLPAGAPPYALRTSTANGSVSAQVRTDPAAERRIDVTTSNGSITVRYG